jgi:O-antigen ligase
MKNKDQANKLSFGVMCLMLGLIMSSATQLRFSENFPVGFGEIMLLLWVFSESNPLVAKNKTQMVSNGIVVLIILLILLSFLVGTIVSINNNLFFINDFFRNFFPILFSFIISIVLINLKDKATYFYNFIFYFPIFLILSLFFLLTYSFFQPTLFSYTIFEYRFLGLSTNPNQLALYLSVIPFMLILRINIFHSRVQKSISVLLMLACFAVAYFCKSDALTVSWLLSIPLYVFYVLEKYKLDTKTLKSVVFKIVLPLILILTTPIVLFFQLQNLETEFIATSEAEGNQGGVRAALWQNGITVMLDSPLFGLGPGAFSGIEKPYDNMEVHNTFIDLGVNAGFIGLFFYLCLVFLIATLLFRKSKILFVWVISLILFSVFHFVLRQPIFWVYLLLPYLFLKQRDILGERNVWNFRLQQS